MQKSYLVKSPVHFADFGFFVKVGDILVHDTSNSNRLTVYRNGEVVKAVKQTSLGIAAMLKNEFIVEVVQTAPSPKAAPKAPAKPPVAPSKAPSKVAPAPGVPISKPVYDKLKEGAKTQGLTAEEFTPAVKRGKAEPKEVPIPDRLREALAIEDETV
jgi:hypothetical protein